ncbi:MAG: hypothetical protein L7V86_26610 [Verrucomicrobiales bacterium]|jgi:hypothetical protein|nr:hypothetical protein [Verrucomicrobiales bacterium]MDF1784940.1 hypothetical protein [Verrucomicrobiales bacterium]
MKTLDAPVEFKDGTAIIPDRKTFREMSYQGEDVSRDTHLTDLEFVKFQIESLDSGYPEVFFLNTVNYQTHPRWMQEVGIVWTRGGGNGGGKSRGEIIFHPHVTAPNGQTGVYRWEFEPNDNFAFDDVQLASEVMARDMPFLRNNLLYYPMPSTALPLYHREKELYDNSRVPILLQEDSVWGYCLLTAQF